MTWTPDAPSTEEVLAAVLSSPLPPLPPQEQRLGASKVSWWEMDPGEVYIHAEGGTPDDRHYASTLVGLQLAPHGFRRAQFDMDVPELRPDLPCPNCGNQSLRFRPVPNLLHCRSCGKSVQMGRDMGLRQQLDLADAYDPAGYPGIGGLEPMLEGVEPKFGAKTAGWTDIMAKAKRLIQSGQVHMLRNGFNYIVGHVVGDHGEYDTEISRDDPQSRAITGWQCSCPWDQYAWQRTRKWKKFEGRPCAHTLALFWKALSTPMDEQLTPEQAEQMGTGQKMTPDAPAVPEHSPETEERIEKGEKPPGADLPRSFGPEGDILQGDQQQMNLPPDALGHPPGPAQAPMAPPPSQGPEPPGILPPFQPPPEPIPYAGPGTTPGGGESPPGAISIPGAKPVTPFNPLQNPGTYSKVAAQFNAPEPVRAKKPLMGLAEGPVPGQYGDGEYREVPAGSPGEVRHQDATTGWIECAFDLNNSGENEPYRITVYVEPGDIESAGDLTPSDPAIRRHTKTAAVMYHVAPQDVRASIEQKGLPRGTYLVNHDRDVPTMQQMDARPTDVWEAQVDPDEVDSDPEQPQHWSIHNTPIPPDRLRRHTKMAGPVDDIMNHLDSIPGVKKPRSASSC